MSFFKNILSGASSEIVFNPQEAVVAILYGTISADGHISDEEKDGLINLGNNTKLLRPMNNVEWKSAIDKAAEIRNNQGIEKLLEIAAPKIPDELRNATFANACDLLLADGRVTSQEEEFLDLLKRYLSISDEIATAVAETMLIKNFL